MPQSLLTLRPSLWRLPAIPALRSTALPGGNTRHRRRRPSWSTPPTEDSGSDYVPIGLAVVAGDLASVRTCGKEASSISDTGAITLNGGESVYIVTYNRVRWTPAVNPVIGVYPSSGVVPSNDAYASPTQIESLPFSVTQDTTLATREPSEPWCFNKFGHGPSVWYSLTATRSELLNMEISSDYPSDFVIVPGIDAPSNSWICGESQFQAEAGTTYLIGVYGWGRLHNSGRLTVNVSGHRRHRRHRRHQPSGSQSHPLEPSTRRPA